jgi:arylsulfatase A-like enzyme
MYQHEDLYPRNFHGSITAMDDQIGRLRAELEHLGVAGKTMLWFCSDNGPEGDETAPGTTNGLRGRKRSLYEGGVRVPGILVWPDMVNEPRVSAIPCSTSDYFPTVLDVLGYQMPDSAKRPYDGVSLLPLIRGRMRKRPEPIAFESRDQVSLTDNRFKIYSNDGGASFELYDLVDDPGETRDIAEERPRTVRRMRKTVENWRASCLASAAGEDYAQS